MACFLLLSVFSLCLVTCSATASQNDGRVDKDRLWKLEWKLNQLMEEHGHLLQQNQDLQRRVSETEKKNDELTIKISCLEDTVKKIQQSNEKQLYKMFEKHLKSFNLNKQKVDGIDTLNSNEMKSYSLHTHIQKRIGKAVFNEFIIIIDDMKIYIYELSTFLRHVLHEYFFLTQFQQRSLQPSK